MVESLTPDHAKQAFKLLQEYKKNKSLETKLSEAFQLLQPNQNNSLDFNNLKSTILSWKMNSLQTDFIVKRIVEMDKNENDEITFDNWVNYFKQF